MKEKSLKGEITKRRELTWVLECFLYVTPHVVDREKSLEAYEERFSKLISESDSKRNRMTNQRLAEGKIPAPQANMGSHLCSSRRGNFDPEGNANASQVNLDLVEEAREQTCKQRAARRYNTKIRPRDFRENDLVWTMAGEARKRREEGKLTAN
ncbi:hypothetical protein CR513_49817, partial [Mucuna pruriens]